MSYLADHRNPLPESVIARGADGDSAHGAQASGAHFPDGWVLDDDLAEDGDL